MTTQAHKSSQSMKRSSAFLFYVHTEYWNRRMKRKMKTNRNKWNPYFDRRICDYKQQQQFRTDGERNNFIDLFEINCHDS